MKIFVSLLISLLSLPLSAQNLWPGTWTGTMEAGTQKIDLILHLSILEDLSYVATWDVPAQGAKGIACKNVKIDDLSISMEFESIPVVFKGTYNPEKDLLEGFWTQSGQKFALNLKQLPLGEQPKEKVFKQTPQAPFGYMSEEIVYAGSKTGLNYGATFTYPKKGKFFKTVILITGSGQQDRNESILGHQSFNVMADYFAKNGIAVLRIDDRGIGKSTGDFSASTSLDFANDVEEHIRYLKTRKEVNPKLIGLCGHSEGGMIAPIVASRNPNDVAFIISMAGPAEPILDLMVDQNKSILLSQGVPEAMVTSYLELYRGMVLSICNATDSVVMQKETKLLLENWKVKNTPSAIEGLTGITDQASEDEFLNTFRTQIGAPWFKFFMSYNPEKAIAGTNCPILAMNGEKDIQVGSKNNMAAWKNITKGKTQAVQIIEFKGLNHLFQKCTTCLLSEYGTLETTIEPEVLKTMVKFIKKRK